MDRRLMKPPVKRCLFGRATNADGFWQTQKRLDEQEEERFKRRWNLDGVENEIQWTKPDTDSIPEFYLKGYSQKCRRRPVRPSVGKTLSFDSDHEDDHNVMDDVTPSPVQYCGASTVEVFIGLLPHQSPQEPHTPMKSDLGRGGSDTPKSENTNSGASESDVVSQFSSQFLTRNLTQRRITDMWRVVKRRQQSLTPGHHHLHKRARIGRL